jgi:hypothetical protein
MKTFALAGLTLGLLGLLAAHASAKRMEPKEVAPVTFKGVIYSVPHEHMGSVAAKDEKTGKQLWIKAVYTVKYDKDLEKDVQDCFITDLTVEKEILKVVNEHGDQYELDQATQAVKVLKGDAVVDRTKK